MLEADARPPWLNESSTLRFVLSGDMPPGEVIDFVHKAWDAIEAGPEEEEP